MLSAEQIQENWKIFLQNIDKYIAEPRKKQLLEFYNKFEDRLILYPASHKAEYHGAFVGGYISHVNNVINAALKLHEVWKEMGAYVETYTLEELIFSAINHDLGKIGNEEQESYIPQTDEWRKNKLGEDYQFNTKVPFCSVPDRSLFLLQSHGIQYSFNEMIAILTHDGLYDEANKKYLQNYMSEQKPRTCLPYILHHADMMAARIEWEQVWLPKLNGEEVKKTIVEKKQNFTLTKKSKVLSTVNSNGVNDAINKFFN